MSGTNGTGGEERTADALRAELLEHIDQMIGYWCGEIDSKLADIPKREALEGLAFSILVAIDGGAAVGPYTLRLILDDGSESVDLREDRELHEQLAEHWRIRSIAGERPFPG